MRPRVFVYIIRETELEREILVFRCREYTNSPIQVPGGGIEPGENPDDAVIREVKEESGIEDITLLSKLEPVNQPDWNTIAYPYLGISKDQLPDHWDFVTNDYFDEKAKAQGENPLVFHYEWLTLPLRGVLNGPQENWLDELLTKAFSGESH